MTHMIHCPKCQCVVEADDLKCDVCGYNIALGKRPKEGALVGMALMAAAGLLIGLLAGAFIVYFGLV
jgi:hypothetical protein